ncbi:MAG: hypothetical protein J2O47_04615 [Acidimicrobiaceae bacterium]|nr:hypothetical protein [Acidimicrobiaceae bacterium]
MSTGVLKCPYRSSHPNEVVLTPGTLISHADRTVGGVSYRWYEWSATCHLNDTASAPVTHTFDAQVWWLPSAGIAFSDVADHPEITAMLDSVRNYVPPPPPTTTTTTPPSSIEFHSPTGNINCGIQIGGAPSNNLVHCFTSVPPQSVTLLPNGTFTTCAGTACLGGAGAGAIDLPYGQATAGGPFSCTSTFGGMICTAGGRGFEISRAGISAA